MIVRKQIAEIGIAAGDEVVSTTVWLNWLIIVTKRGAVFQVLRERHDD